MFKALALTMVLATSAMAAEVDSFTNRYQPLNDSLDIINKKTNEYFQEALNEANEDKDKCSSKELYKSLRKRFQNHYTGEFNKWMLKTDEIEKITVGVEDSIYQDFKWFQAIVPGGFARIFKDPSAELLKVNGIMVGWDKFEHFLGSGYRYFKKNYIKGKGIKAAMKIGYKAETGYMGAATTGVKAYADLVANFNGMRFWNHILLEHDDVLGRNYNMGPYVTCLDNKWVQIKEVNWANYLDHMFDEGVNCSHFKNQNMTEKVLNRIAGLERDDIEGRKYSCPILPKELDKARTKYGEFTDELINFEGHKAFK